MASSSSYKAVGADHLETRVGKVETGLEMLTRDVASLASVVREQGANIERNLRELAVGLTQASAPKKTDWQTLIAVIMLVMAIGSAVFWPLNQTAHDNKIATQRLEETVDTHANLELHPVGAALLGRVEAQLQSHIIDNNKQIESLQALFDKQIEMMQDRIYMRLNKLETSEYERNKADLDELRALRLKTFIYHLEPCPGINGNGK